MVAYNIANCSEQQLARLHAAYETHLRNLHRDAAAHATKLLDKCTLAESAQSRSDYNTLLCFEVIRQLAHETCKGLCGTAELLQLVKEEVEELWADEVAIQSGGCWATDMEAFRANKDLQLDFLDFDRFVMFAAKAGVGLMPADMPGHEASVS